MWRRHGMFQRQCFRFRLLSFASSISQKKSSPKRKAKLSLPIQVEAQPSKRLKSGAKVVRPKKTKTETNLGGTTTFTVEGAMTALPDKTEFGISFRSMSEAEQKLEVVRLNK
jgi:hypothetical protein